MAFGGGGGWELGIRDEGLGIRNDRVPGFRTLYRVDAIEACKFAAVGRQVNGFSTLYRVDAIEAFNRCSLPKVVLKVSVPSIGSMLLKPDARGYGTADEPVSVPSIGSMLLKASSS